MSKDLQRDLKRKRGKRSCKMQKGEPASTLGEMVAIWLVESLDLWMASPDDLLMKLDFRDSDPMIIDLSPKGGRVEGLQESKVECLANDKVRGAGGLV